MQSSQGSLPASSQRRWRKIAHILPALALSIPDEKAGKPGERIVMCLLMKVGLLFI